MSRSVVAFVLSHLVLASAAHAQVVGTFRWNTAPYCNVLHLTVTQSASSFTLDGFDEQCGGNPRQPVHGIAVVQPNGLVTLGLNVVHNPGSLTPVNIEAIVNLSNFNGGWRDSAGNTGTFVFSPAGTTGGPRPGAIPPTSTTIPNTFALQADGGFLARGTVANGTIPAEGAGTRMMWFPGKGAFRAGTASPTGWNNVNIGQHSVAFGTSNIASGVAASAFGSGVTASGDSAFAAGAATAATGPASIALGHDVSASSTGSVTLGSFARNQWEGAFVFGDRSEVAPVAAIGPNSFTVRVEGGARFFTSRHTGNTATGVYLASGGGSWINASDVNLKEHFSDLDGADVLAKLAALPVRAWSYKAQGQAIRHVGPTAQDFRAAFGLGETELGINGVDADGIALRAIQALDVRTRDLTDQLRQENAALKAALAALQKRLDRLETKQQ